ncbi:carotenoid biosynthesis protein [Litorihabitans aurantiacus]|uniref:Carotenoid biosynthesis protein n=1 Tax=Litorihabitans aurantiacus TaxID=1930061 RepID=A0AA38CUK9_9MICO|nr:carotenoid biosynthesis protein [Litorihabitans aurantiacus]GMA32859.1 hypothetical protein GCM10025875_28510 [Litorihabitans aurantiacus]
MSALAVLPPPTAPLGGVRPAHVAAAVGAGVAVGVLAYRRLSRSLRERREAREARERGATPAVATPAPAPRARATGRSEAARAVARHGTLATAHRGRRLAGRAAWVTFAAAVAVQGTFALDGGSIPRTVASVVLMGATAALHATSVGGWRFGAGMVAIVAAATWVAEAVGIATGFPFGEYAYTGTLGPELAGVSVLVLLAWLTLAYPALVVATRLVGEGGGLRRVARLGVAALALTAWDVFLDPQMVDAGNWGWANPEPSLPGTPGIPLTNYAGWFLTSVVVAALLEAWHGRARRRSDARPLGRPQAQRADAVPYAVYLWTYVSCVLGNLTFWSRPSVAVAGGVVMGTVALPLVRALARSANVR